MDPNVRRLGYSSVARAGGLSLILPFVALYLREVLDLPFAEIGVVLALIGVAPVLLAPVGGLVTDRLGRRPLILTTLAAEALAVLGTGAAMAGRWEAGVVAAAVGVSVAGSIGGPALSAYVADLAHGSERTLGFTYLRIGWNVGFAVGVFAGGALIGAIGFAAVGLGAGGVLLVAAATVAVVLDPSPFDRRRQAGRTPDGDRFVRQGSIAASLGLLAGDRVFLAVCVAVGVAFLSVGQWGTTFPLYVTSVLGVPYAILGAGLALNGVLVAVAQAPTTRAAIGHRHTTLLALGIGLYVAGFLLFGLTSVVAVALLAGFFLSVVVLTMGENVLSIATSTLPSNLAPPREVGAYNGTFSAIVGVGQILAPTFGGVVLARGWPAPVTWAVLMLPVVPALAVLRGWIVPRILDRPNRA